MSKEHGGSEQPSTTPSLFSAAVNKFSRMGSNRTLSPSASKYRVSSFLAATGISVTQANSQTQMQQAGVSGSPTGRKLQDLARQTSVRGSRHLLKFSDAAVSDTQSQESAATGSPTRGKLPQKIRASVTRMRSQLTLPITTNSASDSPTRTRQRHSSAFGLVPSVPSSASVAEFSHRRRFSRQVQEIGNQQRRSIHEETSPSRNQSVGGVRLPANNSDPEFVLRFMELVRPLQSSMNSLRDASGRSDIDDDSDEDEDRADAIFRQHERESSRILRICCSLDNLLFAIADQVQEHNNDLLAIARGPAHELVQLILSGIRQIVAAMTTTQPNGDQPGGPTGMPSLTAKEEGYLRDFLVEIADRWSELDELLRGVFVANLESVQKELSELQMLYAELKTEKQALELEMIDIREFNSNQSSATMGVTSNIMRLANQSDSQPRPESNDRDARAEDEHLAGYELWENQEQDGEQRTAAEEVEMLKKQCEEYGRLLEMAKQEIRLSHQERQSQHARLIELSQTLLKDEEVAQLRNELQSEKKRVKRLEIESLSLRETQMDLNMKIQSLQLNQPGANGAVLALNKPTANIRGGSTGSTAAAPHPRSRSGSAVLTSDDVASTTRGSPAQPVDKPEADGPVASTEDEANALIGSSLSLYHGSPLLDAKAPWIRRWVVLGDTDSTENEDDGLIRRFFADLLMTDKEFEVALAQSKLRKRASVPTTGAPPPSSSGPGQLVPPVKKKKPKAAGAPQDPNAVAIPVDEWVQDAIVVTSVRQLIWVFYELYLMAEEARRIDPHLSGRTKWHHTAQSPPLASVVLAYFLERHVSESEAVDRLRRFVLVLSKLRLEYGDIQLFCDFLDGQRSREQLHFYLWTLQAIESVDLGVNYDLDSSMAPANSRLGRYVCTLKALYTSRMVFHFLHVKSLKKPTPNTPAIVTKRTPSIQAAVEQRRTPPPTASSPSKKRRKSRPNSASTTSTTGNSNTPLAEAAATRDQDQAEASAVEKVKQRYAHALATNSGYPLTLEAFNSVVLSFAETPSREELLDRLGGFYQPTGDERKVAFDVFLVLLMELFSTQLYWRKAQLHALFVRLAKGEELAALLAAKKREEEAEAAAAVQGKKGRGPAPDTKEKKKKPKLSPPKKRHRRAGIDGSADKYLRGLSRERFRNFMVQGGLVVDVAEYDMDALYVAILETTDRTPSEMHFEDIYAALAKFEMLGNDSYAVDFSAWDSTDRMASQDKSQLEIQGSVVDEWQQLSKYAIVMTENDPNVYTRRSARHLLRRLTGSKPRNTELEAIKDMRGFLLLAWRVACHRLTARADRREQFQWCLTEFFHLNQAIRTICCADDHYTCATDLGTTAKPPTQRQDDLSLFYDAHIVAYVLSMFTDMSKSNVDDQMKALVSVLQRYSLHIAHLFDSYATSETGLTKDQWVAMAHDLGLVYDHSLSEPMCETMFVTIGSAFAPAESKPSGEQTPNAVHRTVMRGGEVFALDKPRFVVLLVQAAVKKHDAKKRKHKTAEGLLESKRQDVALQLSQIVETFCREIIAPKAFAHPSTMHEEDFHRKLANPLVARALLEHRAFLRHIFFQCAKHNNDEGDFEEPKHQAAALGERQVKNKHNSMALTQFTAFLDAFGLLESRVAAVLPVACRTTGSLSHAFGVLRLDVAGAAYLFRAVMAVESDDNTQMEFDEFAAAVAAIAALRNPHPFQMWHVKIDAFVQELRRRALRTAGTGHHEGITTS